MALASQFLGFTDIAAGVLQPEKLRISQPYWYVANLLSVALAIAFLRWSRPKPTDVETVGESSWQRWLYWLNAASTVLLILMMPVLHGGLVQRALFPVARATMESRVEPVCGLLTLQADKHIVLWHTSRKKGVFTVLHTDSLVHMDVGSAHDLVSIAIQAAASSVPNAQMIFHKGLPLAARA